MSVIMLCGYAKHAAPAGLLDAWRTDAFDAVCVGSCGRDVWMTALCGYLSADALLCARALLAKRRNAGPPARAGAYDDPVLLLHHAVVGVAFGVGMYSRLATSYMAALIVNEASTPFVNLRALINYAVPPRQQRGAVKVLYVANGVVLVFSFGFARVVWTFAICLHICTAWATLWRAGVLAGGARLPVVVSLSILCAAHYAINLVWFRHIVQHVAKQLRQDPETKAI
ncbi:TLC domain-containing protein [Pelagophyceae sp. CCMP2097]|nr:TLC domain-containing protein [Pelagophyceae sp. CCMP2097]